MNYKIEPFADLRKADLHSANLHSANLSGADLSSANLRRVIGNMVEICSFQIDTYAVVFTKNILAIGCQQHSIDDWKTFSDEQISKMDCKAIDFWLKYKDVIFKLIELKYGV